MNRRSVVKRVFLLGGMFSPVSLMLIEAACTSRREKVDSIAETDEERLVEALAAVLIPKTDIPGAEAIGIGSFVRMMVDDCYTPEQRREFVAGLYIIEEESRARFAVDFVSLGDTQRRELISFLTNENQDEVWKRFFKRTRELIFLGYFTSEVGTTQALNYLPVPGKYDPCTNMTPGTKAWIY